MTDQAMKFEVKEAQSSAELEAIIRLRNEILRKPWDQPLETATDDLEQQSLNAYISDENGEVIACGRLQENPGNVGQVRYMAVSEKWRGKGLGKLILTHLETAAWRKGYGLIELQARENAVKFYGSAGYAVMEKTFLLWGIIQHYLMQKKPPLNRL
jgi:predicted GNAT family N-acyltransferase